MHSPSRSLLLICTCALAAGCLIGYVLRGAAEPAPGGETDERSAETSALRPATQRSDSRKSPAAADDPQPGVTALAGVLHGAPSMSRVRDFYKAVSRMSPGEIPAAIALARRASREDRGALSTMLAARWAESDPQAAAEFGARAGGLSPAMKIWAAKDLDAAMSWAQALPASRARTEALGALAVSLAQRDPAAGMKLILTLPDDGYYAIFKEWVARDRATVAQQALTIPPGRKRDTALEKLAHTWAWTDGSATVAWASQIPDAGQREQLMNQAYGIWAGSDPQSATAAAIALPPGARRDRVLSAVGHILGRTDAAEALRVIEQLPAGPERSAAEANILSNWAVRDPQAAAAHAMALPPSEMRTQALGSIARTMTRTNAPAAFALIENLPDGNKKAGIKMSTILQWAESDPRAATEYLLKNPAPGSVRHNEDPLAMMVSSWHRNDPAAALAWTRQVGDQKIRSGLLTAVIRNVAQNNPQEAATLVAELPPEIPDRDLLENIASQYLKTDRNAAEQWINAFPSFSPEQKQRLLRKN